MKKILYLLVLSAVALTACGSAAQPIPTATATATQVEPTAAATDTPIPSPTATATFTPTPTVPVTGYGPTNFPSDVDPLTGLKVADPSLLNRRPMVIKISNLPRYVRPQWGLTLADIVFEYYTESGETRFAGVFYGNDASQVGPIRSGRFIDEYIVRGYKAVFAFGYAYKAEMDRFLSSDIADRLVVEGYNSPLTRYDPNGYNDLVVNTADLSAYATQKGINGKQDLDGMSFNTVLPDGGQPVTQIYVHYSSEIYNRWDYDSASGTYLRYSETANATTGITSEKYAQLTDRLTNKPVAFDNIVVLYVNHKLYSPGIYDIDLNGVGNGYAFRDGQAYQVKWNRGNMDVVSLTNPDGSAFDLKPGTTCFEVIGLSSDLAQNDQSWRFTHAMP